MQHCLSVAPYVSSEQLEVGKFCIMSRFTHFMALVSFYTPWKHQKTSGSTECFCSFFEGFGLTTDICFFISCYLDFQITAVKLLQISCIIAEDIHSVFQFEKLQYQVVEDYFDKY